MTYIHTKIKPSKWSLFFNALANSFIFCGILVNFLTIYFTNPFYNTFNFSPKEIQILIADLLLLFTLIFIYRVYKLNQPEKITLDQNGLKFNKFNIFLKEAEYDLSWKDIDSIKISRIVRGQGLYSYIKFKIIKTNGQIIVLPGQPKTEHTFNLRSSLDDFVSKYNPKIVIKNLGP